MDEKVLQRVFAHARCVDGEFPSCSRIFTALHGSQNYNLGDENSDVDTKSLVLPNFQLLVFDEQRISTTLDLLHNNEKAGVKDVRVAFWEFRHQNINTLEILFTPYVDIVPDFEIYYQNLYEHREEIAHMNPSKALSTMIGMLKNKYFSFEWSLNEENGSYDSKAVSHVLRMQDFLINYFEKNKPFEECLISERPEELLAIKRGALSQKEAIKLCKLTIEWANVFSKKWLAKIPHEENHNTVQFLDNMIYDMFKRMCKGV